MVSLFCFSCDHRNPLGSRFCNACGTPMNFRPCKHCGAINVRAAAHCHQCGETFDLAFLAEDATNEAEKGAAPQPDDTAVVAQGGDQPKPAGIAWRRALPVTVAAVMLATLLVALAPSTAPLPETAVSVSTSAPLPAEVTSPAVPVPPAPVLVSEDARPLPSAPALPVVKRDVEDAKLPSSAPADARSASRASSKRAAASSQRRTANGGRAANATARRDVRQSDRPVVATASRSPSAAAKRSGLQARANVATASERPCAEGTMPEPGCDLRLPKGN